MSQATTDFAGRITTYTAKDYHPDTDDPVDRWLQTEFSSNVLTTAYIILDVYQKIPDMTRKVPQIIVDPFCGAGCTGLAASRLGVPFYGIELDPILAAVALTKATLSDVDVALAAEHLPDDVSVAWLLKNSVPARVLALALVGITNKDTRYRRRSDLLGLLSSGLRAEHRMAVADSIFRCGDSREPASWVGAIPQPEAVIFTSPPFGSIAASPWHEAASEPGMCDLRGLVAREVFGVADRYSSCVASSPPDWNTTGLLCASFRAAQVAYPKYTAIIEFEDASPNKRRLSETVQALEDIPGIAVSAVLKTGQFVRDATFYHIVAASDTQAATRA